MNKKQHTSMRRMATDIRSSLSQEGFSFFFKDKYRHVFIRIVSKIDTCTCLPV